MESSVSCKEPLLPPPYQATSGTSFAQRRSRFLSRFCTPPPGSPNPVHHRAQMKTSSRPDGARSAIIGCAASGAIGALMYGVDTVVVRMRLWHITDVIKTEALVYLILW
ncbi:hypothetical protein M427DRAFT_68511 [Gonapodya prolifera JEL478]|uniref:Uncharacterized protein n=1 Tax=Gonapodya prolifera (strain JEL478) TaxID=1344416 RepID=A0A139AKT8_GONPJ|nr:hypothetical protein M427DRAFT_68511 [Gonapodya prolifera JEL478]|eukprot:KXS17411.1 hypothetical protein M427DRAFT_68511 [Gonapodya prolifera JEL478]